MPRSTTCPPKKQNSWKAVDMVIFRELTGGIYFGKKELSEDGARPWTNVSTIVRRSNGSAGWPLSMHRDAVNT